MKSTLLLLAAATVAHAAAPQPQLYFAPSSLAPSSSSSSSASSSAPALTPQQANAALAHLLSVSHHSQLPLATTKGGNDWLKVLDEDVDAAQPRVVLALECGKYGCEVGTTGENPPPEEGCFLDERSEEDALPPSLSSTPSHYTLPSLPLTSYLSALSLHLHRFAASLGLDLESPAVEGLREFVDEGIKGVVGWQGWVSEELGEWIGWNEIRRKVKAAVEPELPKTGLFSDIDLLDSSAATVVHELEKLTLLADSFTAGPSSRSYNADGSVVADDSAAQNGGQPQIVVVHLKGLKDLSAAHSPSSPTYRTAVALLQRTLAAFYSSISSTTAAASNPAKFLVVTLPPHPAPLLRRKEAWLKPFEVRGAKYGATAKRAGAMNGNVKRSVFSPSANAGRVKRQSDGDDGEGGDEDWAKNAPIVPSSRTCFKSAAEARNQTASCLSRGTVVRGLSTRMGQGEECWVCKCGATEEEGEDGKVRRRRWSGEGCEKEDLSSSFTLLFSSTVLLLAVLFLSVALLYKVGAEGLPGTLGGAGGAGGGHSKRD
ncbi:hypothetical protein JCM6882_004931 [Rhodosporidiobolus microsporus]